MPTRSPREQGLEHRRIAAIGQAHADAAGGGDPGGGQLGGHAAGAPAPAPLGGAAEPLQFLQIAHLVDRAGIGVGAGIAGVEPVDVGEQDQLIGADRHRHQGREGVVVAEAQLIGGEVSFSFTTGTTPQASSCSRVRQAFW